MQVVYMYTVPLQNGIMTTLHNPKSNTDNTVEPKEGQRWRLCSYNVGIRCPSLDFYADPATVSEDDALDYLASIIVEIVLAKPYEPLNPQASSDLLPRINQRTS